MVHFCAHVKNWARLIHSVMWSRTYMYKTRLCFQQSRAPIGRIVEEIRCVDSAGDRVGASKAVCRYTRAQATADHARHLFALLGSLLISSTHARGRASCHGGGAVSHYYKKIWPLRDRGDFSNTRTSSMGYTGDCPMAGAPLQDALGMPACYAPGLAPWGVVGIAAIGLMGRSEVSTT